MVVSTVLHRYTITDNKASLLVASLLWHQAIPKAIDKEDIAFLLQRLYY